VVGCELKDVLMSVLNAENENAWLEIYSEVDFLYSYGNKTDVQNKCCTFVINLK
jgi:hypothetical protein